MIFKRGNGEENSASVFVINCISESRSWSRPGMQGVEFSAPLYAKDTPSEQFGVVYERGGLSERNPQFVTDSVIPNGLSFSNSASINYVAPLFILNDESGHRANFDESKLEQLFSDVEQPDRKSRKIYPEDLFNYIYSSLHSPNYREKYKEFLRTDFPRVPRPKSWAEFWRLVSLGRELRELHLMKSPLLDSYDTTYPIAGSDTVEKLRYDEGTVWINDTQYFGNVPELAWNFYIGGYQPAQKWLKDRKDRQLESEDIDHYQKIIKILLETDRIMKEIR